MLYTLLCSLSVAPTHQLYWCRGCRRKATKAVGLPTIGPREGLERATNRLDKGVIPMQGLRAEVQQ